MDNDLASYMHSCIESTYIFTCKIACVRVCNTCFDFGDRECHADVSALALCFVVAFMSRAGPTVIESEFTNTQAVYRSMLLFSGGQIHVLFYHSEGFVCNNKIILRLCIK